MHVYIGVKGQRQYSPSPSKGPSQTSAEALTWALRGIVLAGPTLPVAPRAGPASLRGGGPDTLPAPMGLPQARVTGRPQSPRAPGSIHCAKKTESPVLGGLGGAQPTEI